MLVPQLSLPLKNTPKQTGIDGHFRTPCMPLQRLFFSIPVQSDSKNLPNPKHYEVKTLRGDCFYCLITVTENEREKAAAVLVIHSRDVLIRRGLRPWGPDQPCQVVRKELQSNKSRIELSRSPRLYCESLTQVCPWVFSRASLTVMLEKIYLSSSSPALLQGNKAPVFSQNLLKMRVNTIVLALNDCIYIHTYFI